MLKDYLNSDEEKDMIIIITTVYSLIKRFHKFTDAKGQGNLKRGCSYIIKGIDSIFDRVGVKEVDKLQRKAKYMTICAIDDEKFKILNKRKIANQKAVYENSKEYFNLVEITMDMNCYNCNKSCNECDLFKHFEENEIMPFDQYTEIGHCKYAYRLGCDEVAKKRE